MGHTLYKDFNCKGTWWIPGHYRKRLGGELSFKAGERISIEVNGRLDGVRIQQSAQ